MANSGGFMVRKDRSRYAIAFVCAVFIAGILSCTSAPKAVPAPPPESERAKAIVQGTSTPDFPATTTTTVPKPVDPNTAAKNIVTSQPPIQAPAPAQAAGSQDDYAMTAEEQAFLATYLSRLSYMVFYNDASGIDPRFAKMAVSQANRYLIEKMGMSVIDFDQIEKNKKDQLDAYQAETRGSIDIIQYLAQKFNADVYLEIDLKASVTGTMGAYNATAQGNIKIYDTSTATLLGSLAFMSPAAFSPSSADSAVANAITASVWQAMPKVMDQSKALMAASLTRGIRYELIVQNTPDAKAVAQFQKALARKVREVEQLSYSPNESRFAVYAFMNKAKVQEAVYAAAESSILPDMYLVYMRGKSLTFNSGL